LQCDQLGGHFRQQRSDFRIGDDAFWFAPDAVEDDAVEANAVSLRLGPIDIARTWDRMVVFITLVTEAMRSGFGDSIFQDQVALLDEPIVDMHLAVERSEAVVRHHDQFDRGTMLLLHCIQARDHLAKHRIDLRINAIDLLFISHAVVLALLLLVRVSIVGGMPKHVTTHVQGTGVEEQQATSLIDLIKTVVHHLGAFIEHHVGLVDETGSIQHLTLVRLVGIREALHHVRTDRICQLGGSFFGHRNRRRRCVGIVLNRHGVDLERLGRHEAESGVARNRDQTTQHAELDLHPVRPLA